MIATMRFPLRNDSAKSQFLRPRVHGRIWFSAQLSMGTAPSSSVDVGRDLPILAGNRSRPSISGRPHLLTKAASGYLLAFAKMQLPS